MMGEQGTGGHGAGVGTGDRAGRRRHGEGCGGGDALPPLPAYVAQLSYVKAEVHAFSPWVTSLLGANALTFDKEA